MNELTTFDFNLTTVRVITIDGEPWFVASDVRAVLGIDRSGTNFDFLNEDEYQVVRKCGLTSLRGHGLAAVSESGLYKFVMRSNKPQAKPFQDWVTRVVLPAIRKTGTYSVAPAQPVLPTTYLSALKALVASEEAKEAAQAQIAQLKPLADVGERVVSHERTLNRIVRRLPRASVGCALSVSAV